MLRLNTLLTNRGFNDVKVPGAPTNQKVWTLDNVWTFKRIFLSKGNTVVYFYKIGMRVKTFNLPQDSEALKDFITRHNWETI